MLFDDFKDEIMVGLGGGIMDTELTDKEYMLAFKRAKRTFIQKGHNSYRREFFRIPTAKNVREYQLPKNIDTVVRVLKPDYSYYDSGDDFVLSAYNQLFYNEPGGMRATGDFLSYELTRQLHEIYDKYAAYETQFTFDKFKSTIRFLNPPKIRNQIFIIECYSNLADEEYMELLWIQQWAAAEAKEMLGYAYRKFSSLPSPTGETSLDGGSMVQEAMQEKERLLQEILDGTDGDVDYYGIVYG